MTTHSHKHVPARRRLILGLILMTLGFIGYGCTLTARDNDGALCDDCTYSVDCGVYPDVADGVDSSAKSSLTAEGDQNEGENLSLQASGGVATGLVPDLAAFLKESINEISTGVPVCAHCVFCSSCGVDIYDDGDIYDAVGNILEGYDVVLRFTPATAPSLPEDVVIIGAAARLTSEAGDATTIFLEPEDVASFNSREPVTVRHQADKPILEASFMFYFVRWNKLTIHIQTEPVAVANMSSASSLAASSPTSVAQ